jgi:hydrogenase maturation protein HypF
MSFILEIDFNSHQNYISDFLSAFFDDKKIASNINQKDFKIVVELDEDEPNLQNALELLNQKMPYSFFMKNISHRFNKEPFLVKKRDEKEKIPLNLGVCNSCKEKMLDESSQNYYNPFTKCDFCGAHYAFFKQYPYKNEILKDIKLSINGVDWHSENYYKSLFQSASTALAEDKKVLIKTTFGYRLFYKATKENITKKSTLLYINSHTLLSDFSLTKSEIESLFSIEKPLLKLSSQSDELKRIFSHVIRCKIADEGFSILLSHELEKLGFNFIAYEECDHKVKADLIIDFEEEINTQSELELFISSDERFIKSGERVSFPAQISTHCDTLCVAKNLIAIKRDSSHVIDKMEHFESTIATKMNLLDGVKSEIAHSNIHTFFASHGAFMATLSTLKITMNAIGVYFEDEDIEFLFCKNSHISTVIPSIKFDPKLLITTLSTLKEGSVRLMQNMQNKNPELYEILQKIEDEELGFFSALSMIVGVGDGGFEALDNEALKFMGKGGTLIDTHTNDNRFNPYIFISSVISYRLAGVESLMISYSIFESLGDYFASTLTQLQSKAKAPHIVLCGKQMAQASLFSKVSQKLKTSKLLLNPSFPIGKDSAILGGIFI